MKTGLDPIEIPLSTGGTLFAVPPPIRALRQAGAVVTRRPDGRAGDIDPAAAARLLSAISGATPAEIDALPASDFNRATGAIVAALGGINVAELLRLAYQVGHFFGDVGEIMAMTIPELVDAAHHAGELAKAGHRR